MRLLVVWSGTEDGMSKRQAAGQWEYGLRIPYPLPPVDVESENAKSELSLLSFYKSIYVKIVG